SVRVRFLHPLLKPARGSHEQEATEREVVVPDARLGDLTTARHDPFAFPEWRTVDRLQHPVAGAVDVSATRVAEGVSRVAVRVSNLTAFEPFGPVTRD